MKPNFVKRKRVMNRTIELNKLPLTSYSGPFIVGEQEWMLYPIRPFV